jgi:proline iminopeptidase
LENGLQHAWQVMHPPLQSYDHGWLDRPARTDNGVRHQIYWEVSGNPLAPAVLGLHGGPGAGCTARDRRWFDPRHWRIVLFDQRGSARSRPLGSLAENNTSACLDDIEALRVHLGIERWMLFGGSWGSTLALAYAQHCPQRVHALVLRGIFTATQAECDWLYQAQGAALQNRQAWLALVHCAGSEPLLEGLLARLAPTDPIAWAHANHPDAPSPQAWAAAKAWRDWELDLMAHEDAAPATTAQTDVSSANQATAVAWARIGVYYALSHYFLEENALLNNLHRMQEIPGIIVQGTLDRVTRPGVAVNLHQRWRGSVLQRIEGAGHGTHHPDLALALVRACAHFSHA